METNLFSRLLEALPLYSEEDDLREEVSELELVKNLPEPEGPGVVKCIRRMFEACGLLDARQLAEGKWAFVSFPASLLGHSLLQTLAVPDQQLFPDGYWRSSLADDIEEQRNLLRSLENRRVERHPTRSPTPIRFVYVAWGVIRMGDSFLLYHRDDISRPEVKNYGFPGGRFKPLDLPADKRDVAILRELHKPASSLAKSALGQTLDRELKEELELTREYWRAMPSVELKLFRKVEGAKNAHGLTEYLIALYAISLTPEGEARLLDRIDTKPEKLVWFSMEDLVDPTGRTDGKKAFIDAFHAHFGEKEPLRRFLQAIPSSSTMEYRFNTRESAVELPALTGKPVLVGGTGKEKERLVKFSNDEHALLLLLGVWGKGLGLKVDDSHLVLLPGGWVKAKSEEAKATLSALQARLVSRELPLLQQGGEHLVRFSVAPQILYFGEELFRYRLSPSPSRNNRGEVTLELRLPDSIWARGQSLSLSPPEIDVPKTMLDTLAAIEPGTVASLDADSFAERNGLYTDETMKTNCKNMLDAKTNGLGLRKLVRMFDSRYRICATRMVD